MTSTVEVHIISHNQMECRNSVAELSEQQTLYKVKSLIDSQTGGPHSCVMSSFFEQLFWQANR